MSIKERILLTVIIIVSLLINVLVSCSAVGIWFGSVSTMVAFIITLYCLIVLILYNFITVIFCIDMFM